jgi:transposase
MTVLHRLMVSGSDRAAERWCRGYALSGIENLELHHLYRAMGWLGEPLPAAEQSADQRLGPRCRKDLIEERLFARRRDLFTSLELVFFDTTSIYFEGEGGESLGQYGYSKDHHPDLKQMVVGAVLDNTGRPLCCFLLPGNTADITTLIPVIDQLKDRFGIHDVCVVARFDGKWVLRTNTDLGPADVALKYKDLLLVESLFRNVKSILETRPIYHKCDDTIRGHVFCSFLALLLMKELQLRLEKQGHAVEWRRLLDDLEALEELTVTTGGKTFVVRTATRGDAGKALQAVGVGLGPKIRRA